MCVEAKIVVLKRVAIFWQTILEMLYHRQNVAMKTELHISYQEITPQN